MKPIPKTGILIGLLVVAWTFVMGVTGWYKHPTLLHLFWVVILLQIGAMTWGLRLTAETNTYRQQIIAGTMMSLIGAAIIFCGSFLFTSVVFPNYFADLRALGEELFRAQGKSEAETARLLDAMATTQTPFWQALLGAVGTVVTGLIASSVIGAVVRRKSA
jgi:hypothetical protein